MIHTDGAPTVAHYPVHRGYPSEDGQANLSDIERAIQALDGYPAPEGEEPYPHYNDEVVTVTLALQRKHIPKLSRIIKSDEGDVFMLPEGAARTLSPTEVQVVRRWISNEGCSRAPHSMAGYVERLLVAAYGPAPTQQEDGER